MTFKNLKRNIVSDFNRLPNKKLKWFYYIIFNPVFKLIFLFRIMQYLSESRIIKLLYYLFMPIYKHYQYKTGIQFNPKVRIGEGIHFPHYGCIVIVFNANIGKNCTIYQGVTIAGVAGENPPIIKDNVILYAGCKIIGNVTIGDNAVVGANAVVTKDVQPNTVVGGIPASNLRLNRKQVNNV